MAAVSSVCAKQPAQSKGISAQLHPPAMVTFGLNALYGRKKSKSDDTLWVGNWNAQNARDLMNYTVSKGYKIESYELGNELCASGVSAKVTAEQYAKDIVELKNVVKELHPDPSSQPKVLGPAGFFDKKWFSTFLENSGQDVVDGLTHHIYNLGPGNDRSLIDKVQDPFYLSQIAQTFKDISDIVKNFGPWSGAWVGESGGAYNSGGKDVSRTFVNGFCALMWHRLMGKNVLSATHNGSPYLRAYSHCSRDKPGITLLLINMSNSTTFEVSVANDENLYPDNMKCNGGMQREEYHLTPECGNLQSDVLLLNGTPLKLTESLDIPSINPELVDASSPIKVSPDSIVFVTLIGFNAPACA
ncbi:hypothetical protein LWI28_002699 [Acer negundo]|uniref:Heparanase-like protein 1 n=1 Tax=Acer negundo TaxID=4023 RepID=A0AAD5IKG0_ACENE|nr:hypothetical protein LWI28_002699 [Acer negundo]